MAIRKDGEQIEPAPAARGLSTRAAVAMLAQQAGRPGARRLDAAGARPDSGRAPARSLRARPARGADQVFQTAGRGSLAGNPPNDGGSDSATQRQYFYANLLVQHVWLQHTTGIATHDEMVNNLKYLFASPMIRGLLGRHRQQQAQHLRRGDRGAEPRHGRDRDLERVRGSPRLLAGEQLPPARTSHRRAPVLDQILDRGHEGRAGDDHDALVGCDTRVRRKAVLQLVSGWCRPRRSSRPRARRCPGMCNPSPTRARPAEFLPCGGSGRAAGRRAGPTSRA
jgi:hypothetical protein